MEEQSQCLPMQQGLSLAGHAELVEIRDAEAGPSGVTAGSASTDDPVLWLVQEMSGCLARLEGRAVQCQDARDVEAMAASIPSMSIGLCPASRPQTGMNKESKEEPAWDFPRDGSNTVDTWMMAIWCPGQGVGSQWHFAC